MPDFTDILSKKAADVEKPVPKPVGNYLASIQGMPKQKKVNVQGEERLIVSFNCKAHSPMEDVDLDDLNNPKVGEISTWPSFNKDIWIDTPEGEFQLTQFLTNTMGIEPMNGKEKKSLGEMCAETPGRQLVITLKHRPYTDKNTNEAEIATDIGATAKA
jgi:hypothetical protein